jgi:hypothetical protein
MDRKNLIRALEDDCVYIPKDHPNYLVFGNPLNPERVLIFEKDCAFESAILSRAKNLSGSLLICTLGNPSKKCLEFISQYKSKKIFWLADLDTTSMFNYLSIKTLKVFPKPKDNLKINIQHAGLSHKVCLKNLDFNRVSIKLSDYEGIILDYLRKFNAPELKDEINFLEKGRKFEIEGFIGLHKGGKEGLKKYLENFLN